MCHLLFVRTTRAITRYPLVAMILSLALATPLSAAPSSGAIPGRIEDGRSKSSQGKPLLLNIYARGPAEQAKSPGPHSLRRSFVELDIAQLQRNAMSSERSGLVLNLFPDLTVEALKSFVEMRGDDYSWFGHLPDHPDDAVVLSVVDAIHSTRDSWNWRADLVTLLVRDFDGACGLTFTLFNGRPKADWSVNGFNVVAINCMTEFFTFVREVGHGLGATHDWAVEPDYDCPPGQAEDSKGDCFTPQVDPWGPDSVGHGFIRHDERRRTIMAYSKECSDRGYECPRYLRFSDPGAYVYDSPLGVPQNQHNAADNRSVINQNRGVVEDFR